MNRPKLIFSLLVALAMAGLAAAIFQTIRLQRALERLDRMAAMQDAATGEGTVSGEENTDPALADGNLLFSTPEQKKTGESGMEDTPGAAEDRSMSALLERAVQSMMANPGKDKKDAQKSGPPKTGTSAAGTPDSAANATAQDRAARKAERKAERKEEKNSASALSVRLVEQAKQLFKSGDYEAARGLMMQSLEEDPKNRDAYRNLTQMQRRMGLVDEEMLTYQQWMENMPNDALARYLAADSFARNGYDAEARDYTAQFQAMSDGDLRAYPMTADLYRRLGLRAEEGATLQQWLSGVPQSPDAHRAMGEYYRRMGDYNAAVAEYQNVAMLTPNNPAAYVSMGNIYRQGGEYANAMVQYQQALALRPGNIDVIGQLAATQRQLGDLNGAINSYGQIIALEPGTRAAANAEQQINRIERQLAKPPPQPKPAPKP